MVDPVDVRIVMNEIAADGIVSGNDPPVAFNISIGDEAVSPYKGFSGWVGAYQDAYKEMFILAMAADARGRELTARAHYLDNDRIVLSALRMITPRR